MSVCNKLSLYEKPLLIGLGISLLFYFIVMDVILYDTFMRVNLADEKLKEGEMLTIFHPLSIKLITDDHVTHYIVTPLSEGLCYYTNFSVNFPFITPNVISFTHLGLGFLSAKFVFSESLYRRRLGVVFYQIRSFLDAFDGSVYRAHAKDKSYKSDHSNFGYWIDITSDTISGFLLCFALLLGFWRKCPPRRSLFSNPTSWFTNGTYSDAELPELQRKRHIEEYSKRYIFWRVFCFGAFWGFTSTMWDLVITSYDKVFTAPLDPAAAILQAEYQHMSQTWWVLWFWRILGGQAVLQVLCIAVFFDKAWELFTYTQFTGIVASGILTVFSKVHLAQVRSSLGL